MLVCSYYQLMEGTELQLMKELQEALASPVRTPDDAERIKAAADLLADYLRLEARARLVLAKGQVPTPLGGGAPEGGDLRGMTLPDAAARVLEDAGIPLHVQQLGERMKSGGWTHPRARNAPRNRIFFQLAATLPQYPDRFRRVRPNTFALAHWDDEGHAEQPRPRIGLFAGPGGTIGRSTAKSEEPVAAEDASWRSS
jgi:hypothetical protein